MRNVSLLFCLLALGSLGCTTPGEHRILSDDWAYDTQRRAREERRKEPEGEIVLMGGEGGAPKTALRMNEEGKAELRLGNNDRWKTDIRLSGGDPEVRVGRQWKWRHRSPAE